MIFRTAGFTSAITLCLLAGSGSSWAGEMVLHQEGVWRVIVNMNNDSGASFNRCIMEANQNGQMFRLAHNGKIWSLSVPAGGHRNGAQGTIGFNGGQPEFFAFASNKDRAWVEVHPDTAEHLSRQKTIEVSLSGKNYKWSLGGASNAMLRLGECLQRFNR